MIGAQRTALAALKFDLAPTPEDVWRPSPFNVPELHRQVVREIFSGVQAARTGNEASPLGVIVEGRAGSGKTHMLGAVRETVQHDGGYFFLVNLINGRTFWQSTALCVVEGLLRDAIGWGTQLKTFLGQLTAQLGIPLGGA